MRMRAGAGSRRRRKCENRARLLDIVDVAVDRGAKHGAELRSERRRRTSGRRSPRRRRLARLRAMRPAARMREDPAGSAAAVFVMLLPGKRTRGSRPGRCRGTAECTLRRCSRHRRRSLRGVEDQVQNSGRNALQSSRPLVPDRLAGDFLELLEFFLGVMNSSFFFPNSAENAPAAP